MLPDRPGWRAIWLGLASTPEKDGYLYVMNEVRTSQTAVFDRRLTIGPADQDSDDFISTLSMGDWSGGGQIDELSGADQSRYWWGIFDNRSPHQAALPPLVQNPNGGKPSGATGSSYPLGVINDTMYYAFGTDICGFNEAGQIWYTKESLGHSPVAKSVKFNGKLFVPCGVNGYKIIEESATGNPTVTAVTGAADPNPTLYDVDSLVHTNPKPIAFQYFETDKIFALTTEGGICWSNTGASGEWEWDWDGGLARYPKIQSSITPYGMKVFFNRNGTETLFINHSGGVFNYQRDIARFRDTNIILPAYPDMARAMEVWRPGEDLWVSMGLDLIHYTAANTTIPLSGVNRDAGLPVEYRGRIVDLQAEASALYAIVGGVNETYRSFEYNAKTGSAGSGTANFSAPQAAAVDSSNNVFVADRDNERIKKYNSALTYQASGGTSGSSNGQFSENDGAYDVAVDETDNVWAVDTANHRIQKFTNALTYSTQIDGKELHSQMGTYDSKFGSSGSGNDNYLSPTHSAIDSTGRVITADRNNERIIIRTSAHVYSSQIPMDDMHTLSLCVDSSDNIYALSRRLSNNEIRVYKFNSSGTLIWTSSSLTTLSSSYACDICTDNTNVYLVLSNPKTLYRVSCSTGSYTNMGVITLCSTYSTSPTGISCSGGILYVCSYGATNYLILSISISLGSSAIVLLGARGVTPGALSFPQGIAVSPATGNIFVSGNNTGEDYISEYTATGSYIQRFGGNGTGNGQLGGVVGVAFNAGGSALYATEATNARIQKFVNSSTYSAGSGDDKFNRPKYLAINRGRWRMLVADTGNKRIQTWNILGTPSYIATQAWTTGSGAGQISASGPGRIAVQQTPSSDAYYYYILDPGNDRCLIFHSVNGYYGAIGSSGSGDGQFQNPTGVAVNEATGSVLIADDSRDDIQEFTSLGQFIRKFGSTGTGDGQMTGPQGLASGRAGNYLYMVDETQNRITQYLDEVTTDSLSSIPHLQRWTGVGWGGVWEGTSGVTPTWMEVVSVVGAYYLTWGASDGNVYRMDLNRYIHNPRQLLLPYGLGKYATTGYIETASSDMNMLGFKKIASHVMVFMRNATATERVKVSIDPDDTGWQELGWVSQNGRTTFPLNPQPPHGRIARDESGNLASLGMSFNWIRMRFDMERGSINTQTPIIRAVNLHFLKVPQNTVTYAMDVVLPKDTFLGRDGEEISDYINSLLTADEMVLMKHHNKLYRGRLANVTGVDAASGNDFGGVRSINFVEITDEGGSL